MRSTVSVIGAAVVDIFAGPVDKGFLRKILCRLEMSECPVEEML